MCKPGPKGARAVGAEQIIREKLAPTSAASARAAGLKRRDGSSRLIAKARTNLSNLLGLVVLRLSLKDSPTD